MIEIGIVKDLEIIDNHFYIFLNTNLLTTGDILTFKDKFSLIITSIHAMGIPEESKYRVSVVSDDNNFIKDFDVTDLGKGNVLTLEDKYVKMTFKRPDDK